MKIIHNITTLRHTITELKARGHSVGFVPTMGALHDGHAALIRRCVKKHDITVLSIFVNPLQFGPAEDYRRYPRPKKNDKLLAKKENVDIIFLPSVKEMYPEGESLTYVDVPEFSSALCGKSRPGHFRGVCTVVAKLLNIVRPHALYLGQKDYQQSVIIRRMVKDLNMPVRVNTVPTVREPDGLALSSRNKYLSPEQRTQATVLYQSLIIGKRKILAGEHDTAEVVRWIKRHIRRKTGGDIDYVACVQADSLVPVSRAKGKLVLALAVRFGQARLIDNILLRVI